VGDEDGNDISTDLDNGPGRGHGFVVAKQEESVVARPGFRVHLFLYKTLFLVIDIDSSLVGRWTPRFLFANNLCPRSTSITRTYLRGYYMEKQCKVS
jgi:hypothetical protein